MKKTVNKTQLSKLLKNKVVLITGGAGSLGSAIAKELLNYPVKSIRVFDNNEHALFKLKRSLTDPRVRFLLGTILDKDRIELAGFGVDVVIHTAALKNIEITEYNPIDTIDVNVNGTINMIKSVIKNKPKIFINISTDKVAESSTLYGNTKQLGERLTNWAGPHILTTKFATVRLGNIIETRGNVFEVWKEQVENNQSLTITDPKMNRYFFHMEEAVEFIFKCITKVNRGEIFVPKMNLFNIKDLALKISKNYKVIGLRQGEKLQEILITDDEKKISQEKDDMWIIQNYH
ncbi:SDR family NAD(P)-dependent oxidoreductase [Nitrosopumilus sp.]|uniref:SDR family NAD(P)-dependent oxidoreductase n=1 Tax=Nitrosopumilus sp. TaxID=2024843 RepID=UPI00247D153A|nr:SDR family NAD(P)-dependent oxidoreductase [Nitrosopumilus sp.]MCV0410543.1 polysaccharide biosynthesis protein [Nitrosopumilus sp.]